MQLRLLRDTDGVLTPPNPIIPIFLVFKPFLLLNSSIRSSGRMLSPASCPCSLPPKSLVGIITVQTVRFFRTFRKDKIWLKVLVRVLGSFISTSIPRPDQVARLLRSLAYGTFCDPFFNRNKV